MRNSWKSVTVEQLLEIVELSEMELTPTELAIERLSIVTGTNYFDSDLDDIDPIIKEYTYLDNLPTNTIDKSFRHLSFGNFIDLEYYITSDIPIKSIDKICQIIQQTDIDTILNLSVHTCYPILTTYLNYRNRIIDKYKGLFEDEEEEEEIDEEEKKEAIEESESKFPWQKLIYRLCNGDITKSKEVTSLGHIMVFNWLSLENQPSAKKL